MAADYRRQGRASHEMGPYFKPTKQICAIYSQDRSKTYVVRIFPRIDRGFFISDNDWTCYRRNYFQVTTSFTCFDAQGQKVELPCLVEVEGRGLRTVTEFQLHITSKTSNGNRDVDLVQHTAKRDKGPQSIPNPKHIDPSDLAPSFGGRSDAESLTCVTWERVQFKSATANNGKRRAAQQYHALFVEVLARCDDGYLARVASSESAPLVVRGRAPGHYAAMASKEANEMGEGVMPPFPYGYPTNPASAGTPGAPVSGDANSSYYQHMMQGYYYHPYYTNPSLWASGATTGSPGSQSMVMPYPYGMQPTAEQLAAAAVAATEGEQPIMQTEQVHGQEEIVSQGNIIGEEEDDQEDHDQEDGPPSGEFNAFDEAHKKKRGRPAKKLEA